MSKINEGFVGDDESKEEGLVNDSSNEITRTEVPYTGEIDFSRASKSPIVLASFAGNKQEYFSINIFFHKPIFFIA